ncbi:TcpE family [Gemella morbillorum]|jgi:hypothetical protein|uniref:TcpE family conjugal transfer membrane protein n=1 Tax=Gemella morbillorum TaxID=29391 RepID=UPI000DA4075B|nr:TcpE family conjugal transfer membrane protein [Gemella morbillorum]UBH80467.1 conjugal transfer protein [Gemella morbillorum]SQH55865.1 TcpE family [Gemella morbillorum]
MKSLYNYTKALKEPMKIRQIKGYTISRNGIRVVTVAIFFVIAFLFYILDRIIPMVKVMGYAYYGFPIFITWAIININVDGKSMVIYLYDYLKWKIGINMKNKKYSFDEEIKYRSKHIKFN